MKITHFPVIHTRRGSIGYKLEWNGLSMIYTGDTKPEYHSIQQAAGVNVFVHEMNPPAEVWAFKNMGLYEPPKVGWTSYNNFQDSVDFAKMVQNRVQLSLREKRGHPYVFRGLQGTHHVLWLLVLKLPSKLKCDSHLCSLVERRNTIQEEGSFAVNILSG